MTEDTTSLDLLRSYECPEGCEFFSGDEPMVSERDAAIMLGGDDLGFLRCIDCGAELEQTIDAMFDGLAMIVERHPELAERIVERVEGLAAGFDSES